MLEKSCIFKPQILNLKKVAGSDRTKKGQIGAKRESSGPWPDVREDTLLLAQTFVWVGFF